MTKVIEVFGQFAVELEDGPALFETAAEAALALSEYANGAANTQLAREYTNSQGLDGKNAKGKINVITSFLAWVDAREVEGNEAVSSEQPEVSGDPSEISF